MNLNFLHNFLHQLNWNLFLYNLWMTNHLLNFRRNHLSYLLTIWNQFLWCYFYYLLIHQYLLYRLFNYCRDLNWNFNNCLHLYIFFYYILYRLLYLNRNWFLNDYRLFNHSFSISRPLNFYWNTLLYFIQNINRLFQYPFNFHNFRLRTIKCQNGRNVCYLKYLLRD